MAVVVYGLMPLEKLMLTVLLSNRQFKKLLIEPTQKIADIKEIIG
jgi:hypothetical protein